MAVEMKAKNIWTYQAHPKLSFSQKSMVDKEIYYAPQYPDYTGTRYRKKTCPLIQENL